jgi:hypothetical protein
MVTVVAQRLGLKRMNAIYYQIRQLDMHETSQKPDISLA